MSTQYTTGQSPSRDCLSVHITCAFMPGEELDHVILPVGADGRNVSAYRVNTYIGKQIKPTTYIAQPDTKLHLFRTPFHRDLFYICELQSYRQRYTCSCGGWFCDHIRQLRGQEVRS